MALFTPKNTINYSAFFCMQRVSVFQNFARTLAHERQLHGRIIDFSLSKVTNSLANKMFGLEAFKALVHVESKLGK